MYIFDVETTPALMSDGAPLFELLDASDIVKVLHDCRNDCVTLYVQHGIRLAHVFDTQVM